MKYFNFPSIFPLIYSFNFFTNKIQHPTSFSQTLFAFEFCSIFCFNNGMFVNDVKHSYVFNASEKYVIFPSTNEIAKSTGLIFSQFEYVLSKKEKYIFVS